MVLCGALLVSLIFLLKSEKAHWVFSEEFKKLYFHLWFALNSLKLEYPFDGIPEIQPEFVGGPTLDT